MQHGRSDIRVTKTGAATATIGAVANSGYIGGDVILHTGPIPRSAYMEQVQQIAPEHLAGREVELQALADFCCQHRGPSFAWWQAPAWAGKSALMAWFVQNPPSGIRIVPFFVTARFAGQGDRAAFVEVVLEQLLDLLNRPMPAALSGATKEAHLLRTLADAAAECRSRGQRLVLLVDGLDEDRGVTAGADAYSIAALLPNRLAGDMRIIVASREHLHVPDDVPDDHPLRDPAIVVSLSPSPHAAVVRQDMTRELRRLLDGSPLEVSIIGLVTAAGGGLTANDLATLAATDTWRVEDLMRSVTGRSFRPRPPRWGSNDHVYVFGHEELHALAISRFGAAGLEEYRSRLHNWADGVREKGWPSDTPEYLLRGYVRMLRDTGEVQRMIALAADESRHDRLLAVSGGDAAAMTELEEAQAALLAQPTTDLLAMARLTIHRAKLRERNARLPILLPALWTAIGQAARGEALALSISEPRKRAHALVGMIHEISRSGQSAPARRLADLAEDAIRDIPNSMGSSADVREQLATAIAVTDPSRASALIGKVTEPVQRARGLAALAVERCRHFPSLENCAEAEQLIRDVGQAHDAVRLLSGLCIVVLSDGERDPAVGERILNTAQNLVAKMNDPYGKPRAMSELVRPTALLDPSRARQLMNDATRLVAEIPHPHSRAAAYRKLAEDAAAVGLRTDAESLLHEAENVLSDTRVNVRQDADDQNPADFNHEPGHKVPTPVSHEVISGLLSCAFVSLRLGDAEPATRLAINVETAARQTGNFNPERYAEVAHALAAAGHHEAAVTYIDHAKRLSESLADYQAVSLLTNLLLPMKENGDPDGALQLSYRVEQQIRQLERPSSALHDLADALGHLGEQERSRALAAEAQAMAPSTKRVILRKLGDAQRLMNATDQLQKSDQRDEVPSILDHVETIARELDRDNAALVYSWIAAAAAEFSTPAEAQRSHRLIAMAFALCETWTIPLFAVTHQSPDLLLRVVEYAQSIHMLEVVCPDQ